MDNKQELDELYDLKIKIQSKVFQNRIMQPVIKELEKLKSAYDCNTTEEIANIKGRRDGIMFLINLLKQTDNDLKNKKFEIDNTDT